MKKKQKQKSNLIQRVSLTQQHDLEDALDEIWIKSMYLFTMG